VAPFKVGIINLRAGDKTCDVVCEEIYSKMHDQSIEALYDDRNESIGIKFADMDLIGLPWQIIIGPRGVKNHKVELKNRASGLKEELTIDDALNRILG
jgi:prolyl-tRNA synthetase